MYSAESTTPYNDVKRQSTTQKLTVSSTTQSKMTSTQTQGKRRTNTEPKNSSFASFLRHNLNICMACLKLFTAYISSAKFWLYFLLAYVQNQKLKKVGAVILLKATNALKCTWGFVQCVCQIIAMV